MNSLEFNFLSILAILLILLQDPVLKRKISEWF